MADRVRHEFLHAWNGYKQYARGHDELQPLTKTPHDWYGTSLYMTPVDALDTMILMGLNKEADEDRELVAKNLSFDKDIYVKNFEITIRMLGGLLSSYELSSDKRLLVLAEDLGDRLLPVFNSPTGMPYVEVNLHTGAVRNESQIPLKSERCCSNSASSANSPANRSISTRPNAPSSNSTIVAQRLASSAMAST